MYVKIIILSVGGFLSRWAAARGNFRSAEPKFAHTVYDKPDR